jgi:hypothetical protein
MPGEPAVQVVEVVGAGQKLADDERRAAVGEDLRRTGDGAVLAVPVQASTSQAGSGQPASGSFTILVLTEA